MNLQQAVKYLEKYNEWRRGAEIPQPCPTKLGIAIEICVNELKTKEDFIEKFTEWVQINYYNHDEYDTIEVPDRNPKSIERGTWCDARNYKIYKTKELLTKFKDNVYGSTD